MCASQLVPLRHKPREDDDDDLTVNHKISSTVYASTDKMMAFLKYTLILF